MQVEMFYTQKEYREQLDQSAYSANLARSAFLHARSKGFPHFSLTLKQKQAAFEKLRKFCFTPMITHEGVVKQSNHGLTLAWTYFPHHWQIRAGGKSMKTPYEVFNDDELLEQAIKRKIKRVGPHVIENGGLINDSNLRAAISSCSGVQKVSNFRPSAAAAIYKKYAGDGVVWDMSCGFGGRLLGALASQVVSKYIGTDPSTPTFKGLEELKNDICKDKYWMKVELNQIGSEDFVPSEPVDLCFTSPPYFNCEEYSEDEAQSCNRYTSVELWNENFLKKTILNCHAALKPNRYLVLNVANVSKHKNLERDTIQIAEAVGFRLIETLQLQLSSVSKGGSKYEPIFVFEKTS